MRLFWATLTAGILTGMAPAGDGLAEAYRVFEKYESALKGIKGVLAVTVGGSKGETKMVIRVSGETAREAVRLLLGGRLEGVPVYVVVGAGEAAQEGGAPNSSQARIAGDPSSCTRGCPLHCRGGASTAAGPGTPLLAHPGFDVTRINDPSYAHEQCDILRHYLGLPKLKHEPPYCEQMFTTTNDPEKVRWIIENGFPHWRSHELGFLVGSSVKGLACPQHGSHAVGELIATTWIRHRQFCPLGMKQILVDIDKMTPKPGLDHQFTK